MWRRTGSESHRCVRNKRTDDQGTSSPTTAVLPGSERGDGGVAERHARHNHRFGPARGRTFTCTTAQRRAHDRQFTFDLRSGLSRAASKLFRRRCQWDWLRRYRWSAHVCAYVSSGPKRHVFSGRTVLAGPLLGIQYELHRRRPVATGDVNGGLQATSFCGAGPAAGRM